MLRFSEAEETRIQNHAERCVVCSPRLEAAETLKQVGHFTMTIARHSAEEEQIFKLLNGILLHHKGLEEVIEFQSQVESTSSVK